MVKNGTGWGDVEPCRKVLLDKRQKTDSRKSRSLGVLLLASLVLGLTIYHLCALPLPALPLPCALVRAPALVNLFLTIVS
ncbi:hypothetical protein BC01_039 [Bacillus phage BC01]|nr:hypothetical protein BC01_039 [Bacillus phage BC01]